MDKVHDIKKAVAYSMEKHLTCETLRVAIILGSACLYKLVMF